MIGLSRSSLQYRPAQRDDDALRLALIRLAKQYGRYGYRKIAELLRVEGWRVNYKKIERIWREEGLQLPQRHKDGVEASMEDLLRVHLPGYEQASLRRTISRLDVMGAEKNCAPKFTARIDIPLVPKQFLMEFERRTLN